ncbi:hypothetical protein Peur_005862 [Populus x canadensis]
MPVSRKLYSYSAKDNDRPIPNAIFLVNFDKDNCYRVSKTPLGEPVKGKNKTTTKLWLEKFYQKTTNLPEPFPHELVERLEKYLDEGHRLKLQQAAGSSRYDVMARREELSGVNMLRWEGINRRPPNTNQIKNPASSNNSNSSNIGLETSKRRPIKWARQSVCHNSILTHDRANLTYQPNKRIPNSQRTTSLASKIQKVDPSFLPKKRTRHCTRTSRIKSIHVYKV